MPRTVFLGNEWRQGIPGNIDTVRRWYKNKVVKEINVWLPKDHPLIVEQNRLFNEKHQNLENVPSPSLPADWNFDNHSKIINANLIVSQMLHYKKEKRAFLFRWCLYLFFILLLLFITSIVVYLKGFGVWIWLLIIIVLFVNTIRPKEKLLSQPTNLEQYKGAKSYLRSEEAKRQLPLERKYNDLLVEYHIQQKNVSSFFDVRLAENKEKRDVELGKLKYTKFDWWMSLDPLDFEKEVARIYQKHGYRAQLTPRTGDRGVDIILTGQDNNKVIVQCKAKQSYVGPATVRELIGTMHDWQVTKAVLVSLNSFSSEARQLGEKHNIECVDLPQLVKLGRNLS